MYSVRVLYNKTVDLCDNKIELFSFCHFVIKVAIHILYELLIYRNI